MWRWTVFVTAVLLISCQANTPQTAPETRVAIPGIAGDSSRRGRTAINPAAGC